MKFVVEYILDGNLCTSFLVWDSLEEAENYSKVLINTGVVSKVRVRELVSTIK